MTEAHGMRVRRDAPPASGTRDGPRDPEAGLQIVSGRPIPSAPPPLVDVVQDDGGGMWDISRLRLSLGA